jgi:hypothetical protein
MEIEIKVNVPLESLRQDQSQVIQRVANVLRAHDLQVKIIADVTPIVDRIIETTSGFNVKFD